MQVFHFFSVISEMESLWYSSLSHFDFLFFFFESLGAGTWRRNCLGEEPIL